jgi:Flp pilus assembly protein TadD
MKELPAIVAASTLDRLARQPTQAGLFKAIDALQSPDPLVRWSAISLVALAQPPDRLTLLAPLLTDNSRLVRMDAARALAGEPESLMDAPTRQAFDTALAEYVESQSFNADRPETNANLAGLYQEQGDIARARSYFETALKRDPKFVPAIIGLAQLYRGQGDDSESTALLRDAAVAQPDSPDLAHAYGLALVRGGAHDEAMEWLRKAARLGQDNSRFAYVYAIALHDTGNVTSAIAALRGSLSGHPYDQDILTALLNYEMERQDYKSAIQRAETLLRLQPGNQALRQLLEQLRQRSP